MPGLPNFVRHAGLSLTRHAMFVILIVGLLFDGWLVWQSMEQWLDQPLPSDRVTAKQLRVNETQRQELLQHLDQYHQPSTPPTILSGLF